MEIQFDNLIQIIQTSQVSSLDVVVSMTIAFILSLFIAYIYRVTYKGIAYSQSYVMTIVLLAPITAMVMLTIGSDLARAFGLVGALSIIRFRTVIKDTKDIAIIFLSLVAGLSAGTLNYHIAVIGTLLILIFLYLMDKFEYGKSYNKSYLISFNVPKDNINENEYTGILEKYSEDVRLLNISSSNINTKLVEITYKVEALSSRERAAITKDLTAIDSLSNITIISAKNYTEY